MKTGTMFYDHEVGRMDICFENGDTYGGLHCGECLDVEIDGAYVQARMEYYQKEWYLVGTDLCGASELKGLRVKI